MNVNASTLVVAMIAVVSYGSRERHFFHCLQHDLCFRMRRIVSACGDSLSVCRGGDLCGDPFPRAEERLRMRRFVFRVRRTIGVPRAENRLRMRRQVFRVRRNVSTCGDSCSACGGPFPHVKPLFRVRRTRSPHAETRAMFQMLRKRQLHCVI